MTTAFVACSRSLLAVSRRRWRPRHWPSAWPPLGDGTLRLSFAARPGVCGNGQQQHFDRRLGRRVGGRLRAWPVRVSLRVQDGAVAEAHTYVGGRWRSGRAGRPTWARCRRASAAAISSRSPSAVPEAEEELITAATLADSAVIWPRADRARAEHGLGADGHPPARHLLARPGGRQAATRGPRFASRAMEPATWSCGSRRCSRCRSGRKTRAFRS